MVTLSGLVKYLQDRVPKRVALDLGAGKEQRPFATVEGYHADELVMAAVGRKPSALKEQNIRRLLALTKASELAQMIANQQFEQLKQTLPSDVPPRVLAIFKEELDAVNYTELMLPIYDKHLTDEEVNDLVAFYETPLGRKLIEILPVIYQEGTAAGAKRGQLAADRAIERIKAEGLIPKDKN